MPPEARAAADTGRVRRVAAAPPTGPRSGGYLAGRRLLVPPPPIPPPPPPPPLYNRSIARLALAEWTLADSRAPLNPRAEYGRCLGLLLPPPPPPPPPPHDSQRVPSAHLRSAGRSLKIFAARGGGVCDTFFLSLIPSVRYRTTTTQYAVVSVGALR